MENKTDAQTNTQSDSQVDVPMPVNGNVNVNDKPQSFMTNALSNFRSMFAPHDSYLRGPNQPLISTNLRYFGFVNDVGEALKSFIPKPIYYGTYGITGVYAAGAVYYHNRLLTDRDDPRTTAKTVDNAVWHTLATVTLTPLVAIPMIKKATKKVLSPTNMSVALKTKSIPAAISILAIPAVVSPVDNGVTWVMNQFREQPESYHWSGYWSFMNKGDHSHEN
ncbi:mitochondrial fission process protein 1-like [Yasminevirus sp. GU-2018]|uniref:Mitochondrial fission process protein 1-like n=1 Tax=Yasminevirus sp. GU-2018 TaxID=2420051 RepID=A0A5K0U7J0_9VIRU|nr:mitochondrial fission process protein 1-like [Yasminevirus sp. GU-2018]